LTCLVLCGKESVIQRTAILWHYIYIWNMEYWILNEYFDISFFLFWLARICLLPLSVRDTCVLARAKTYLHAYMQGRRRGLQAGPLQGINFFSSLSLNNINIFSLNNKITNTLTLFNSIFLIPPLYTCLFYVKYTNIYTFHDPINHLGMQEENPEHFRKPETDYFSIKEMLSKP
jgi:hypothetical protein